MGIKVLALDPATASGWALYDGDIESGTWNFKTMLDRSPGDAYAALMWNIDVFFNGLDVDLIVLEEPAAPPKKINVGSLAKQHGFAAVCRLCAAKHDVGYLVYYPAEIQAYAKAEVTRMCSDAAIGEYGVMFDGEKGSKLFTCAYFVEETGRMPVDNNEADAYSLLRLALKDQGVDVRGVDAV